MNSTNKEFLLSCSKKRAAKGKDAKVRCVAYARISDENKETDLSIDVQLSKCFNYAKTHKIKLVKSWSEPKSSMNPKRRTAFAEMLDFVHDKTNDIDCIIVFNFSRFGRNLEEILKLTREMREAGKRVISTQEDYGDDANGRFIQNITFTVNEHQVVKAADDTFECMQKAAERGCVTGPACYGFKIEQVKGSGEKRYVIDNSGPADVVRFIFQSVADGLSYKSIQEELSGLGIKTKSGVNFSKGTLNSMLANVKYKGWNRYNRQDKQPKEYRVTRLQGKEILVPGALPQIVSEELFDKVQAILAKRQSGSHEFSGLDSVYILKNKVKCSCGRVMHGTVKTNAKGTTARYYHCPDHVGTGCLVKDINKNYLEYAVFSIIDLVANSGAVKEQILFNLQNKEDEIKNIIKKTKRDIAEAKERHANFVDNLGQNWDAATMEAVRAKIQKSAAEVERLIGVLNQHQNKLKALEKLRSADMPEQRTAGYDSPQKRRLVERVLESVVVDAGKATLNLRT